jgi:hypothetical protein
MELFIKWLFEPSPLMDLPTRATPNLYDVLIVFSLSYQEFSEIDWLLVLADVNTRRG